VPLNVATLVARVVADTSGFSRGMAGAESRLAATGESMRSTGRALTTSLTLPIVATAAVATDFAIKFQKDMTMIHTQAGVATDRVAALQKGVMDLAPATRYGPDELAKALYHIESVTAGTESNANALNVLKVAAEGAAVGSANLEDTASALIGTMRVFHTPITDASKTMGTLNAIVGAGNMRMQDLNMAISTGLMPTARSLHLGLADVGSALAMMTDESTPAQVAATRMRTALLMMTGETQKSQTVMKSLGMGSLEMAHDLNKPDGLVIALRDLKEHLDKIPDSARKTQIVAQMFGGARSSGSVLQWLNNLDMIHTKFDQINKTAANFPEAVLATQATESFKLHQAWAAIQVVLVQIGGIIAPVVTQLAVFISKAVQGFQSLSPELQKIVVFGALIVAGLGPAIFIIGSVLTTFTALAGIVGALISPIGLVVAAIAGLVAGFILLYQHSEAFRNGVNSLFNSLRSDAGPVISGVMNLVHALGDVFSGTGVTWNAVGQRMAGALRVLQSVAGAVTSFVSSMFNEMAGGIRAHSQEIRATVTAAWNDIRSVSATVWPYIEGIVRVAWSAIKIVVQTSMRAIGQVILAVMAVIRGDWSGAWQHIKNAAVTILEGLAKLVWTILSGIAPLALRAATAIGKAVITGILHGLVDLAKLGVRLIAGVNSAINNAESAAVSEAASIGEGIVSGILGGIGDLAGSLADKLKGAVGSAIGSVKGLLHMNSPSRLTRDQLGKPIGEGIVVGATEATGKLAGALTKKTADQIAVASNAAEIRMATRVLGRGVVQGIINGVIGKQQSLAQQLHQALKDAVDQAVAQAKSDAQSKMQQMMSDFQNIASSALSTFEQQTSDYVSPAQQQLSQMQVEDQVKQYQDAVNSSSADLRTANAALQAAMAGGDQTTIDQARQQQAQAQAAYDAAVRQQKEFQLSQLAAQQTQAYQDQRAAQEEALAQQLKDLQDQLAKHPKQWKKIMGEINDLLAANNIPLYTAGQEAIDAFKNGLESQIKELEKAARKAARAVAKYLKLKSPAEEGPLSDLDHWWDSFVPTLLQGFDPSELDHAVTGALTPIALAVGANPSAHHSLTEQAAHARSAPTVYIEHQHVNNDLDPILAANTIARKVAYY
jgi:TP901 family phage tail tape measure protein